MSRKLNYPVTYVEDLSMREARKLMHNVINARREKTPIPARWTTFFIAVALILGGLYGLR